MEVRRVILTNWNAGVFSSKELPHLLPELVIYALLYDEVLIREEDLLTNRQITRLLSREENCRFFEAMLVSGLVRLLRLPISEYPEGRRFDPVRLPISARAEEHELRRSYKGKHWKPTRLEWRLFERLDRIVYDYPSASKPHMDFPSGNAFAEKLADVLEGRGGYQPSRHPLLRKIDPKTVDAFISFCREPEAWQKFLHDQGAGSVIGGPDGRFFRSAAYQCSSLLPNPGRIQSLVESVYAATFCDREHSEGRYGGMLFELPYKLGTMEGRKQAEEMLVKVEVVATGATVQVPLISDLADVILRTRQSREYRELRSLLSRLGTEDALPLESEFREAWIGVCDVYANHLGFLLVRPEHSGAAGVGRYGIWAYLLARVLGLIVIPHGPLGLEAAVVVDHAIEHYGLDLLRSFRAIWRVPSQRENLVNAARIRTSRIVLRTDKAKEDVVERA